MAIRLTANQWAVLGAVVDRQLDGKSTAAGYLGDMLGTTPQGVHQTAASLVRKGLLFRHRQRNAVVYKVSPAGLRAHEQHRRRVTPCLACRPGATVTRHTCGLAGLQDMLRIGGSR